MALLSFPDEVVEHINSFCSVHGMVNLGMTCRRLHTLCESRQAWTVKLQGLDIRTAPDIPPYTSVNDLTVKELKRKVVDATLSSIAWRKRYGLELTLKGELRLDSDLMDFPATARLVPGRDEVLLVNGSHLELWSIESKLCIWSARGTASIDVVGEETSMECISFDFDVQKSDESMCLVIAAEYASAILAITELRVFRYNIATSHGELVLQKLLPQVLDLELTVRGEVVLARFVRLHKIALIEWRSRNATHVDLVDPQMENLNLNRRLRAATLSDDGRHVVGIVMYERCLSVLTFSSSSCFSTSPETRSNDDDWAHVFLNINSLPITPLTHHALPPAMGRENPRIISSYLFKPTWKPDSPTEFFVVTYDRSSSGKDKLLTSFRIHLRLTPPQPTPTPTPKPESSNPAGASMEQSLTLTLIPSVIDFVQTNTSQIPWDPYCITNTGRIFCLRDSLRCFSILDPSYQPIKKFEIPDHPWMDVATTTAGDSGVVSLDPIVTSVDPWSETIVVMTRGTVRLYRIG